MHRTMVVNQRVKSLYGKRTPERLMTSSTSDSLTEMQIIITFPDIPIKMKQVLC